MTAPALAYERINGLAVLGIGDECPDCGKNAKASMGGTIVCWACYWQMVPVWKAGAGAYACPSCWRRFTLRRDVAAHLRDGHHISFARIARMMGLGLKSTRTIVYQSRRAKKAGAS